MMKINKSILLLILITPAILFAKNFSITAESHLKGDFIGEYLSYMEDARGMVDIDTVIKSNDTLPWTDGISPYFSMGFTDSIYWFRLVISNETPAPVSFFIEYVYGAIDEVYFYSSNKKYAFMAGDKLPYKERQIDNNTPVFLVVQPPGSQTYYLKVKASGHLRVKLKLYSVPEFHRQTAKKNILYGMYFSVFFIMSIINYYLSLMPTTSASSQKLYLSKRLKYYFTNKSQKEEKYHENEVFLFLSILSLTTIYHTAYYTGFAFQSVFQYLHFLFPGLVNYLFNINSLLTVLCFNIIARNFLVLKEDKAFQFFLLWQYRLLPVFLFIGLSIPYFWSGRIVPCFAIITVIICHIWIFYILIFSPSSQIVKFPIILVVFALIGCVLELISGTGIIKITNGWIEWGMRSISISIFFTGIIYNAFYRFYVDREKQEEHYLKQLVQSQKAETEINNKIAHELMTPVTAIVLGSNRLLKSSGLTDSTEKTVRLIKGQATQLRSLTRNYLRMVRLDRHQENFIFERCNLIDIIEDTLRITVSFNNDPEYMHRLLFQKPDTPSLFIIQADKENLSIAIKNIIQNAIKYTPKNGIIKITLRKKRKGVCISVTDNGKGISDKNQQDIFFPFFQADYQKDFDKGVGLGLTIVKKIINKHNGDIKITSPLDPEYFSDLDLNETRKGTSFEIYIPGNN